MRAFTQLLLLLCLIPIVQAASPFAKALGKPVLLPAEQAFILDVLDVNANAITLNIHIEPGYYLYRSQFTFTPSPELLIGEVTLPEGIEKTDDFFGAQQVYAQNTLITIPVREYKHNQATLSVAYQGCADIGVCYPPQEKTLTLDFTDAAPTKNTNAFSSQQDAHNVLAERHFTLALIIFFGLGLLLALTPCVLPMLPILSSIILGQKNPSRMRAFELSFIYVIAVALTFAIAGIASALLGASLQSSLQQPWLLGASAALLIILALLLFADYPLQLPSRWQNKINFFQQKQKRGSLWGAGSMGVLSALIVSPCVTPPLIGALLYIAESGNPWLGGGALFMLGLGMGVPLILFAIFGAHVLPKQGAWMQTIRNIFALLLIVLAFTILARFLPPALMLSLWGILALIAGVALGAFDRADNLFLRLKKALGIILLLYGALLIIDAYWKKPLQFVENTLTLDAAPTFDYIPVKTLADVNAQLLLAKANTQVTILDFYADWCVSCVTMSRNVFPSAQVQPLLENVRFLIADVTANDTDDRALQKHFDVFGPPAIHFFSAEGVEQPEFTLVGEINADDFAEHLRRWLAPV